MEAVTTSLPLPLKPDNLPPTKIAFFFHAFCVQLKLAQWKLLDVNHLNQLERGGRHGVSQAFFDDIIYHFPNPFEFPN